MASVGSWDLLMYPNQETNNIASDEHCCRGADWYTDCDGYSASTSSYTTDSEDDLNTQNTVDESLSSSSEEIVVIPSSSSSSSSSSHGEAGGCRKDSCFCNPPRANSKADANGQDLNEVVGSPPQYIHRAALTLDDISAAAVSIRNPLSLWLYKISYDLAAPPIRTIGPCVVTLLGPRTYVFRKQETLVPETPPPPGSGKQTAASSSAGCLDTAAREDHPSIQHKKRHQQKWQGSDDDNLVEEVLSQSAPNSPQTKKKYGRYHEKEDRSRFLSPQPPKPRSSRKMSGAVLVTINKTDDEEEEHASEKKKKKKEKEERKKNGNVFLGYSFPNGSVGQLSCTTESSYCSSESASSNTNTSLCDEHCEYLVTSDDEELVDLGADGTKCNGRNSRYSVISQGESLDTSSTRTQIRPHSFIVVENYDVFDCSPMSDALPPVAPRTEQLRIEAPCRCHSKRPAPCCPCKCVNCCSNNQVASPSSSSSDLDFQIIAPLDQDTKKHCCRGHIPCCYIHRTRESSSGCSRRKRRSESSDFELVSRSSSSSSNNNNEERDVLSKRRVRKCKRRHVKSNAGKEHDDGSSCALSKMQEHWNSFFWLTYRTGLDFIVRSDAGWGCMHRTGQMLLARAFSACVLGPRFRIHKLKCQTTNRSKTSERARGEMSRKYLFLLSFFEDVPHAPFSLQNICKVGAQALCKRVGDWFAPSTVAHALYVINQNTIGSPVEIHVASNSTVCVPDILEAGFAGKKQWRPVVLLIALRLGVAEFHACYAKMLLSLFNWPQFLGVAGGKRGASLYFTGTTSSLTTTLSPTQREAQEEEKEEDEEKEKEGSKLDAAEEAAGDEEDLLDGTQLLYLDPHYPQQYRPVGGAPDAMYHTRCVRAMRLRALDPSMLLGFLFKHDTDVSDFAKRADAWRTDPTPLFTVTTNNQQQ